MSDSEEEFEFESNSEHSEEDDEAVQIENNFYEADDQKLQHPDTALQQFQRVVALENERQSKGGVAVWKFKALQNIVVLGARVGKLQEMRDSYVELLSLLPTVTRNDASDAINGVLDAVDRFRIKDAADTSAAEVVEMFEMTLEKLQQDESQSLWVTTCLKLARLHLAHGNAVRLGQLIPRVYRVLEAAAGAGGATASPSHWNELYAVELEFCVLTRAFDKIAILRPKIEANLAQIADYNPRNLATIREILGVHLFLREKRWPEAYNELFEAFQLYQNAIGNSEKAKSLLKLVILVNLFMLGGAASGGSESTSSGGSRSTSRAAAQSRENNGAMGKSTTGAAGAGAASSSAAGGANGKPAAADAINPFDSREAKMYAEEPEIHAFLQLREALQENDWDGLRNMLGIVGSGGGIFAAAAPDLAQYRQELIQCCREKVAVHFMKAYKKIRLAKLAALLKLETGAEGATNLITKLIVCGKLHAGVRINEPKGLVVMTDADLVASCAQEGEGSRGPWSGKAGTGARFAERIREMADRGSLAAARVSTLHSLSLGQQAQAAATGAQKEASSSSSGQGRSGGGKNDVASSAASAAAGAVPLSTSEQAQATKAVARQHTTSSSPRELLREGGIGSPQSPGGGDVTAELPRLRTIRPPGTAATVGTGSATAAAPAASAYAGSSSSAAGPSSSSRRNNEQQDQGADHHSASNKGTLVQLTSQHKNQKQNQAAAHQSGRSRSSQMRRRPQNTRPLTSSETWMQALEHISLNLHQESQTFGGWG